jgi:hypothetical protein
LQRLEVRAPPIIDGDDFSIQEKRRRKAPEGIGDRPEEVRERMAVARDEPRRSALDARHDPKPVPFGLVRSIGGGEQGVGLLKKHGRRLARMRRGAPPVEAEVGQGWGDGWVNMGSIPIVAKMRPR